MSPSPAGRKEALVLTIADASQVAAARRLAGALARSVGFGETEAGRVALVVTEAATNLVKHAGGGEILLHPLREGAVGGIEILALDRGRGIENLEACLLDGYSTAGSPGTGLGAIRRLAQACEIHSVPGVGTALLARLWAEPPPPHPPRGLSVGAVWVARPAEEICGDGWAIAEHPDRTLILVVDGLGHGLVAAEAAQEATRAFHANVQLGHAAILEAIHGALRSTRGAAGAVTAIEPADGVIKFAGIGNIAGAILSGSGSRHLVSHHGTLGHTVRLIDEFTYPWPPDGVLVEHTDGLASHWDVRKYPGLGTRDPSLVAGVLYRDFKRGPDDVTVVVARGPAA